MFNLIGAFLLRWRYELGRTRSRLQLNPLVASFQRYVLNNIIIVSAKEFFNWKEWYTNYDAKKLKKKKEKLRRNSKERERRKLIPLILTYLSWNRFWMSFSEAAKNSSSSNSVGMAFAFDKTRWELISIGSGSCEFSRSSLELFISLLQRPTPKNYYGSEL